MFLSVVLLLVAVPATVALSCGKGEYLNMTECVKCGPGEFQYRENHTKTSCEVCIEGMYTAKNGSEECTKCEAGTYQQHNNSMKCKECPVGTYSELERGSTKCDSCREGHYQDKRGQSKCLECPVMTYQDQEGASSCKPCPSNTYQDEQGQGSCIDCPDYEDESKIPPGCIWKTCPKGYIKTTTNTGKTICKLCERGQFQPVEDGKECKSCPRGTYSAQIGSQKCTACPLNAWTPTGGMASFYDCTGPSLQLFYSENGVEKSVIVFGSEIPPERKDTPPDAEFNRARVLSGVWKVAGKEVSEGEWFTSSNFTVREVSPIIENVFCYYPGYLPYFKGRINKTVNGEYCQAWSCDDIGGKHDNFCVTGSKCGKVGSKEEPWCLNKKGKVTTCGVPVCGWDNKCKTTKEGRSYRGQVSHTSRGYTCRNWEASWPHPNTGYDDEELYGVGDHNFCRNPDPDYTTLYCFTTNWFKRSDDCDNVPLCDGREHPRYLY